MAAVDGGVEEIGRQKLMFVSIEEQKNFLRGAVRNLVKSLSPATRTQASSKLCKRLVEQEIWRTAQSISFFAPMPDEPDIWPLMSLAISAGKTVSLPRFSSTSQSYTICAVKDFDSEIEIGAFGIREAAATCDEVPLNRLDLVLVPGVAFDAHGRRLGRGKGFYDRLLADVSGKKCGVAFDEQIVAEVPAGPHDVSLNCILTPTRWIET